MLSESDRNPMPIYRVYRNGEYIQFFYDYDKALAFVNFAQSLVAADVFMIDEGF
jgi:hypothetical protein